MDRIIDAVVNDPDNFMPLVAVFIIFGGAFIVGIFSIVFGTIVKTTRAKEVEQSRREIAAYIAEGSLSPEEGEKLLTADPSKRRA